MFGWHGHVIFANADELVYSTSYLASIPQVSNFVNIVVGTNSHGATIRKLQLLNWQKRTHLAIFGVTIFALN